MAKHSSKVIAAVLLTCLLLAQMTGAQQGARQNQPEEPYGGWPHFVLIRPTKDYLARLKAARASQHDYFWELTKNKPGGPTYENIKNLMAPIRYVNAPWRYSGIILSPMGSTEKMRVIENGFQIDANLTRQTPTVPNASSAIWAMGNTHLWTFVGPKDEPFGEDEHRQGKPYYQDGYLPVFHVDYEEGGTTYEEAVFVHRLLASYRSPCIDEPGVAAYIRLTAKNGPGRVSFEVKGPPVGYGFPILSAGFGNNEWTDAHNNVFAWFSPGGTYDQKTKLVRFTLKPGESVYVVFPHTKQLAGTEVTADATHFAKARSEVIAEWKDQLVEGGRIEVPEKVAMSAYRSLLIGDWEASIGDEVPYGMFNWYEGNGYPESMETLSPFIEYGYFSDARRFIQPIVDYPITDKGVGLQACISQLKLATYYYELSGDSDFIRRNQARLIKIADFLLAHRNPKSGLILDGYMFDLPNLRVVNLNTNSNGWRAIRDLGLVFDDIGEPSLGQRYLSVAKVFGDEVRQKILTSIDHSTVPPFVPFALGFEKPYQSLVESRAASYYNIAMPYFFESEIFAPQAAPYTDAEEYMWHHQGVMAGLNRFDSHVNPQLARGGFPIFAQDGIHPLYTWGRAFSQIARHEAERAVYTFYCELAFAYTRGTFVTGECQSTVPREDEWYRRTYLPPEPPANALLLRSLRHMLIHENDLNQDGIFDELWLLSATPRTWLESGKEIDLSHMPSRFGPVSLRMVSDIANGKIAGTATFTERISGKAVLLFVRLPEGYRVSGAFLDSGKPLTLSERGDDPVVELPATPGTVHFSIEVVCQ